MVFIVYVKYQGDKRYKRECITGNSYRADKNATSMSMRDDVAAVKVVCDDGYYKETLQYK